MTNMVNFIFIDSLYELYLRSEWAWSKTVWQQLFKWHFNFVSCFIQTSKLNINTKLWNHLSARTTRSSGLFGICYNHTMIKFYIFTFRCNSWAKSSSLRANSRRISRIFYVASIVHFTRFWWSQSSANLKTWIWAISIFSNFPSSFNYIRKIIIILIIKYMIEVFICNCFQLWCRWVILSRFWWLRNL